jgi:excisionase family DNA binding protein
MSSFVSRSAHLLAEEGFRLPSTFTLREIATAFSTKRPQSFAALNFRPHLAETWSITSAHHEREGAPMTISPLTISPLQPRSDRQLVFTSSQAARYVGVSLATIRRWTDAGHINCYRTPGGQRRFSRDQLDEFVTSMQDAGEIHGQPAAQVA